MYNSNLNDEYFQHHYIQEYPNLYCKSLRHRLGIQERLKLPYCPKCRNPTCSYDCKKNCAHKESACIARHLHDLPDEFKTFRGNLTLTKDASPDDHRGVKKSFNQMLRRWVKKNGYIVEFRAELHATNATNAHWDFQGYTDAPITPFKREFRRMWVSAGGHRATCVSTSDDELDDVSKYQSKLEESARLIKKDELSIKFESETASKDEPEALPDDQFRAKLRALCLDENNPQSDDHENARPIKKDELSIKFESETDPKMNKIKRPHLLKSRSEMGLERTWTTGNFWRDTTMSQIWKMLILEWFSDSEKRESKKFHMHHVTKQQEEGYYHPRGVHLGWGGVSTKNVLDGSSLSIINKNRARIRKLDTFNFVKNLPVYPATVSLPAYACQWGVTPSYAHERLCDEFLVEHGENGWSRLI